MGWSIGYDDTWKRDIGYGVPAQCDHPDCVAEIDRGLSYVCGGEPYGGEPYGGDEGCGLYFCTAHVGRLCERCEATKSPFAKKGDVVEWVMHKLTDESWQRWRDENPKEVEFLKKSTLAAQPASDAGEVKP